MKGHGSHEPHAQGIRPRNRAGWGPWEKTADVQRDRGAVWGWGSSLQSCTDIFLHPLPGRAVSLLASATSTLLCGHHQCKAPRGVSGPLRVLNYSMIIPFIVKTIIPCYSKATDDLDLDAITHLATGWLEPRSSELTSDSIAKCVS